jgi:hypothetical protein
VTQFWKHLAPDNSEYYHSSSAHVRTWLLGILQTKHLAHTHTHTMKTTSKTTHTQLTAGIYPLILQSDPKKNNNKSSYLVFRFTAAPRQHTPSPAPPPPPPLLLLLILSDSQTDDHKTKQKTDQNKSKEETTKKTPESRSSRGGCNRITSSSCCDGLPRDETRREGDKEGTREGTETRGAATAAPHYTSALSLFPFSSLLHVCECACVTARTQSA